MSLGQVEASVEVATEKHYALGKKGLLVLALNKRP